MKAKSLLTACLFMLAVGAQAANDARAILHHDKKPVAIYDADKLAEAISAAVEGDTIYLSAGAFPTITLDKAITIKGAGATTDIAEGVSINIANKPTLNAALLDAVEVLGNVVVNSEINGFTIKSVDCESVVFNTNCPKALIDRCDIMEFKTTDVMKDIYLRNCYIEKLTNEKWIYNKCTFVNCNIWECGAGRFINCQIRGGSDIQSSIFSYCMLNSSYLSIGSSSYIENCKNVEMYYSFKTAEECIANGWLGNDGTPIGMYGGKTPYTLSPSGPKETSSSVKVDDKEKKLNVTITVSPK